MLHVVPMFYYNWLLYARRPEHDSFFEEDDGDENKKEFKHQTLQRNLRFLRRHKTSSFSEPEEESDSDCDERNRQGLDCRQKQVPQKEDNSTVSSNYSVSSNSPGSVPSPFPPIRSLFMQTNFSDWLISTLDTANVTVVDPENSADSIPPMPIIPYVSIDVRSPESTERSEEEEDCANESCGDEELRRQVETFALAMNNRFNTTNYCGGNTSGTEQSEIGSLYSNEELQKLLESLNNSCIGESEKELEEEGVKKASSLLDSNLCHEEEELGPLVPFITIDLRSFVSEKGGCDDEDDDCCSQKLQRIMEIQTCDPSSSDADEVSCSEKNWRKPFNFPSPSIHGSSALEEEASLGVDDLVPLRDEDLTSMDGLAETTSSAETDTLMMFMKDIKPQSFLLDYHSSHHQSSASTLCTPSSTIQRKPKLKQMLARVHANLHQETTQEGEQEHNLASQHSWNNNSDGDPLRTSTSTPYLLALERQQRNNAAAAHSHRCFFPSNISFIAESSYNRFISADDDHTEEAIFREEILDPTDPLVFGKIDHFPYVKSISDRMNSLLKRGNGEDGDMCREGLALITKHPIACQVKYQVELDNHHSLCLPLHYFSARGWLNGCQAAYDAYPEAIGIQSAHIGLPLHFVCLYQADKDDIVSFMVEKFPDGTRFTNQKYLQTPLHLACQSPLCRFETARILLEQFPTAAQLADIHGFTPLHHAVQHGLHLPILKALKAAGPSSIWATTKNWHKPLHLAALHGCGVDILQWLVQHDKRAAACTLDDFSTPLHCAVLGLKNVTCRDAAAKLLCLREAHPEAVNWTNQQDQTPYDLAVSLDLDLGCRHAVLEVLMPSPQRMESRRNSVAQSLALNTGDRKNFVQSSAM